MAAVGRTARGLRRVPSYRPPRAPQREAPPQERERKRRPVRYKLFSLGAGLDMSLLIFILVLLAIGLPHEIAHGSLRLTLNEEISKEDMDYVVDSLKEIIDKLRSMSPLYEDFIKKQK